MSRPAARATLPPSYTASIRHLRAFITVAKHHSFSRAATELRLSQPSLTMTIRQFEDLVGSSLFDRTTRTVTLTQEGQDLLFVAERVVHDFDLAIQNIRLAAALRSSCIRIAMVHSVATRIMPRILDRFLRHRPGLRVQMREGNSGDVRQLVMRNEVDLGFCSKHEDEAELVFTPLFRDQLGVLARFDHPVLREARNGCVKWDDLAGHDFVGLTPDTATGPILSRLDHLPASVRQPRYEVSTYPTLWALVQSGLGVTTSPALAADFPEGSTMTFLGLKDPVAWREVYLVSRLGRSHSPAIRALIQAVTDEIAAIAQDHPRIEANPDVPGNRQRNS